MDIVQSISATSMAIFYTVGVATTSNYPVQNVGWMVSDAGIYEQVQGEQTARLIESDGAVESGEDEVSQKSPQKLHFEKSSVKEVVESDAKSSTSIPDMKTIIPSVEDEDRMRESLVKIFKEKGLPEAPAVNAATYLSREWVMAAAHEEWRAIPKYRPLRDGIKKRTGMRYFVGDHFADYWQPSLSRGLLYRHFILQYDEEFAADLATHISRTKRKSPESAINLPKKSDYNSMLLSNIESVMGHDAYNAINAHASRSSRKPQPIA